MFVGAMCVLCAATQSSFALVYTGGLDHTTAPDVDPGWDSVATMSIGSGVYLGDGWVLAPYHVYQHNPSGGRYVDLDRRYYEILDTARRIEDSASMDADLVMFRIEGDPDLPLVEIADASPLDKEVTVIASGRSRIGDLIDFGGGYEGFATSSQRAKRWGQNVTDESVYAKSSAYGRTVSLMTSFDSPGVGDDECQLVTNDSGGAAFVASSPGEPWRLAGLALSVDIAPDYVGPSIAHNAVYGSRTFYADLASYQAQIDVIRRIPLPGDADWDGDVDGDDIDIFTTTFGHTGPDLRADFNDDDMVNLKDFAIMRYNFGLISGHGIPDDDGSGGQAVPEPATILLLAGSIPLLWRTRRRR